MADDTQDQRDGVAEQLILAACEARERAYAPYSRYRVGAAILTADGDVFTGCNIENAVYPLATCAERTAAVHAVADGQRRFAAVAVVTSDGGSPCGACRQILREFGGPGLVVYVATPNGRYRVYTLAQLLPDSFGPENLAVGCDPA
ncbi:MAG: cytidine deaminase [Anaerolineae bacterium]